jgi:biopolymer transport protein ExbB
LAAAGAAAGDPRDAGAPDRAEDALQDPIQRIGGPVAVVILAVSVVLVALVIEHAVVLRTSVLCPKELFVELEDLLIDGRVVRAMQLLSADGSPLARVAEAGLAACGQSEAAIEAALSDAGNQQTLRLYQKISYVNLIVVISPMLGLLGTVLGMIGAFASFTEGASKADLGPNISNALLTTFEGLSIAIPGLVAHTYFRNRVNLTMLSMADLGKRIKSLILALPADAVATLGREQRRAAQQQRQPGRTD